MHTDMKYINDCQEMGQGENGKQVFHVYGVSFWGDENILGLDSGTTMWMHWIPIPI